MRINPLLFVIFLLVTPVEAVISTGNPTNATNLTPQRNIYDLANQTSSVLSGATNYTNTSIPGKMLPPQDKIKKMFWVVVVLLGGAVLMGVALNRPGGFSKFKSEFLIVLGMGLVIMGVIFGK